MGIKIKIIPHGQQKFTTVGYWAFSGPNNTGDLIITISRMKSYRYMVAVAGHELIEALWCKLAGVTTEIADVFDERCEREMAAGMRDVHIEPGFDKECPYHIGHVLGAHWEDLVIFLTFPFTPKAIADADYARACNRVMNIQD